MVRSICKVGLALALATAWVGLAWSQPPRGSANPPEAAQAMMTVHENGKALQCRILSSWKCANGARAFQLEVLASGEKLTIMEDGPGNAFQSQSGRMRTLPMRIFHWGRSKNSPAGAPVPPDNMISEREVGEPKIIDESDAVLVRITPEPVAPPGCEICSGVNCGKNAMSNCDCGNAPCDQCDGPKPGQSLASRTTSPYSPMQGSMSSQTKVIEPPAVEDRLKPVPTANATEVAQLNPNPKENEAVRSAPPPLLTKAPDSSTPPGPGNPPPLPGNINAKTLPASEPSEPSNPTPTDSGPAQGGLPSAKATAPPATEVGSTAPMEVASPVVQAMPMQMQGMPSKQPRGLVNRIRNAISPDAGRPPEQLTNRVGPDIPVTQGPQIAEMAQRPAVAAPPSKSPSPQGTPAPIPMMGQRAPAGELPTSVPGSTQPGPGQGPGPFPINNAPPASPGLFFEGPQSNAMPPGQGPSMFAGPATQNATPPGASGASKPAMLPGATPNNAGKPMTFPGLGGANTQTRPGYPPSTSRNEQRDWRTAWGKPPAGQPQSPGQSLVEPTPSGKGPAFQPGSDGMAETRTPPAMTSKPPTSMSQNPKQSDPLLSPERFGTPRVESKTRGEARTKEPMPPMPQVPPAGAPNAKTPATKPLGVQSVMAAHNGLDMPLRYIPVPTVTIPQPVRPPGPPKPEIPHAPAPADFVNAFSAPKPPADPNAAQHGQQNGPPMGPMANPYGMIDPRMMQRGPMPNMQYGPGPAMNGGMMPPGTRPPSGASPEMLAALAMFPDGGSSLYRSPRPVANMNYPRTYQGPMAPNPVGGNMNPQAYMPALQPYYAPAPAYPPAPYYPQGYAPMPPVAVPMPQEFGADPGKLLSVLVQSPYPAQREWAVMGLAALDLRAQPEILQALLTAAQKDPAASVRAGCIQCVARQNVAAQPVLQTLNTLKSDPDPRVRNDAEQALIRLTGSYSTVPTQPIQPTSARQ